MDQTSPSQPPEHPTAGNTFVLIQSADGAWSFDGPHDSGSDLTQTYRILNQIESPKQLLELTIDANGFPHVKDAARQAQQAGKAACIIPGCDVTGWHIPGITCYLGPFEDDSYVRVPGSPS